MLSLVKKLMQRTILIVVIVVLAGYMNMPAAQAITLIPPSLEVGLTAGLSLETVIKLFNESSDTVELFTETTNFTAKGETGQPDFDFDAEPIGLSSWLSLESGPIVLQPGERYEVPITINPPVNADPGGHYAAVFFTTQPPEEGQVKVASKVGTLILARVEGDIKEAGIISIFDVENGQSFFNRLPVEFFARFQNTGNVHLKPTGAITVKNTFGKETASIEFNASKGATLPDTTRMYKAIWESGIVNEVSGNFWTKYWQEYGNEKNNFALGKYTATLAISAGTNGAVTDSNEVSFWVIPWRVLLLWSLMAAVGVILIIMLLKRYNAWVIKKAKK
ncbi:hypothetical protein IID19_03515 [Patescibacteria group bacterium]|nr:hypothetical protein [Patescibacteria group bacterium]